MTLFVLLVEVQEIIFAWIDGWQNICQRLPFLYKEASDAEIYVAAEQETFAYVVVRIHWVVVMIDGVQNTKSHEFRAISIIKNTALYALITQTTRILGIITHQNLHTDHNLRRRQECNSCAPKIATALIQLTSASQAALVSSHLGFEKRFLHHQLLPRMVHTLMLAAAAPSQRLLDPMLFQAGAIHQ